MQIMILVVALILAAGVALSIVSSRRQQRKERIISVVTGADHLANPGETQEKRLAKKRADIAKSLKEAGKTSAKKNSLKIKIQQAGLDISVGQFWVFSCIFGLTICAVLKMIDLNPIAFWLLAFVAFFGIPRFVLRFRRNRRQKKFLEEFADSLEAMVRLLHAGMPVSEAISMVAREYTGPVGEEMMTMYEDQKVGISMGEAAERAAARMPLTEMQMFATAIQIQAETGSSLSEVLQNLAAVIRARFRLKRKVKALSSEAKASAAIIGSLPILVALGLYLVNPDYIMLLFTDSFGKLLATGACVWMTLGMLVMRQMINFKV